jgi:hypothetical protein
VKKFYFLGMSLMLVNALTAAIYCEMDTTQPLKCSFSCRHPNRIMVEKQSIEKVIHSEPESIQILIEEKASQAFVMACNDILDPITLCVITSNGEVQDLEVTFEEQPSQLVILQQKKQAILPEVLPVEECQIQAVIQSVLANQVPEGSYVANFCTDPSYLRKKIKIIEVSRFDREFEVIRVFEISNCSKQKQIIHEKELSIENAAWVFLEKNTLRPKETITAIISIKKDFF